MGAYNLLNLKQLSVFCSILLLASSGCIFSPKKGGDSPPPKPVYFIPASPEIVLQNYITAYEARDTTQMNLIYDESYPYKGESTDNTDPIGPKTIIFDKADEIAHVAALNRATSITSVSLNFGTTYVRSTDLGDPVGWATIQISNTFLEISDTPTPYSLPSTGEDIEFKFIPTPVPHAESPTDTTWKIVKWIERYTP